MMHIAVSTSIVNAIFVAFGFRYNSTIKNIMYKTEMKVTMFISLSSNLCIDFNCSSLFKLSTVYS